MSARLDYIDLENAAGLLRTMEQTVIPETREAIAAGASNLQSEYSSLRDFCDSLACVKYALGRPLLDVRRHLWEAADAELHLLRMRSSGPRSSRDAQAAAIGDLEPLAEDADYSLTNSYDNYLGVCDALIVGDQPLAAALAALIWDPTDCDYIGGRSEVCTPNQQRLAYALREWFAEDVQAAKRFLVSVQPRAKAEQKLQEEAAMLRAIVEHSPGGFLTAVEASLFFHSNIARRKQNLRNALLYMDRPALAFCRVAIDRGVCGLADLPANNPFLPIEFLSMS